MLKHLFITSSIAILLAATPGLAQSPPAAPPAPAATAAAATTTEPQFTQAELETMVGPVALYPDTLLMQILVSSTAPLDVMKADQYLQNNAEISDDQRKQYAESQNWDESVKVLTTAFPDVVEDMADHIDWTESMGDAMLAQSDDVMKAVQTMRRRAIDNGSLVSGDEQKVSFLETPATAATTATTTGSSDAAQQPVVITPTDPQKVYVPQYDTHEVYSNNLGNVVATTAVAFGTAALISDIFDDDDDWDHYWGCHDCGGWNGQPIIRDPNINLDVDGNVRIGNRVDVDRNRLRAERDKIAWKPNQAKIQSARTNIAQKRELHGGNLTSINKNASVQDDLRRKLQNRPGDRIAGRGAAGSAAARARLDHRPEVDRPTHFSPETKTKAVNRTKAAQAHRASAGGHVAPKKPVAHRAQTPRKPAAHRPAGHAKPTAIKRQASGAHTRAASHRGHASRGHQVHRR